MLTIIQKIRMRVCVPIRITKFLNIDRDRRTEVQCVSFVKSLRQTTHHSFRDSALFPRRRNIRRLIPRCR